MVLSLGRNVRSKSLIERFVHDTVKVYIFRMLRDDLEDCIKTIMDEPWFSEKEDRVVLLLNKFNSSDYRTLSIYHGMGNWAYVHRKSPDDLFRVYVGEQDDIEQSVMEEILGPYDFYKVNIPETAKSYDSLYIGVEPGTTDKPLCHGWKQYRLGLVDEYCDE